MPATILLTTGKHSINTPAGLKSMLEDMLAKSGIDEGEFKTHIGPCIRGSEHSKGLSLGQFDVKTNSFLVKAQPGGNGTRHRCTVHFPEMHRENATVLYGQISAAFQKDIQEDIPPETGEVPMHKKSPAHASPDTQQTDAVQSSYGYLHRLDHLDDTAVGCILVEIQHLHGTAWVSKGKLFKIISGLKLPYRDGAVVSYLIKNGFLEPHNDTRHPRSRISSKGEDLLAALMPTPEKFSEMGKLEVLNKLASQHKELLSTAKAIEDDIDCFRKQISELQSMISGLEKEIEDKNQEAAEVRKFITPKMSEASELLSKLMEFDI